MEDSQTEENQSNRWVEITWAGHSFPNYADVVSELMLPLDIKKHMDESGGPLVMNYRFIKDFTKGVDDSWTINAINYFHLNYPNNED